MASYHLQFDDRDVESGLLNVDADGCLKGVAPERVFFTETLDDGTVLCCGRPAKEMTQDEAYALCLAAYWANALYVANDTRVLTLENHRSGIGAAYCYIYYSSGVFTTANPPPSRLWPSQALNLKPKTTDRPKLITKGG